MKNALTSALAIAALLLAGPALASGSSTTSPQRASQGHVLHAKHRAAAKPQAKGSGNSSGTHLVSFNEKTHKYHESGCRYYGCAACDEMPLDKAIAAGGVPCQKCH